MDNKVKEVALLFLKLGITAFGGPSAHIAMMQQEVVTKRKWMTQQHFLNIIGAVNLIPGPNSTEIAIHTGYSRAGWKGLVAAGICFILPAVLITGAFAWLYKTYGSLPQVQPFVYGIKPAVIAIILSAVYPLGKKAIKSFILGVLGLTVLLLAIIGISEIYLMFGAGLLFMLLFSLQNKKTLSFTPSGITVLFSAEAFNSQNIKLFLIFLKVGAILYGSGYALFAFLDTELVATGMLTKKQLIDAIAVGQFTPGPVFSSVTFIGYQINGLWGAIVATIGIFIPSFVFVGFIGPIMKKLESSSLFSAFLDAVNVAAVAVIAAVCFSMAQESVTNWRTVIIALLAIVAAFHYKINSAYIILGGSVAGYLLLLL